jgi:hypothetical protein
MTVPIPHRHGPHVHIPWSPVASILVVAAAVIAMVVVVLVEHPWESTLPGSRPATTGEAATSTAVRTAGQAVAVPRPESQVMLRHPAELGAVATVTGQAVAVPKPESQSMLHHPAVPRTTPVPVAAGASASSASGVGIHQLVRGIDLDPRGYGDVQPPAPRYLPGAVVNPHPLNVVAGAPR